MVREWITACIEGFFDVKKGVENAIKSTNFISKFCTLKSVIKLKLFLLCHSLFLEKFEFNYTFQGAKFANKICTFYSIFYTLFYIKKSFYAGCGCDRHDTSSLSHCELGGGESCTVPAIRQQRERVKTNGWYCGMRRDGVPGTLRDDLRLALKRSVRGSWRDPETRSARPQCRDRLEADGGEDVCLASRSP
jgi:hypothetical protein